MALTKSVAEIVAQDTSGLLGAHPSWQRVPLRDLARVLNGFPFDSAGFNADHGMPLARIRDVVAGSTSTRFDGPYDRAFLLADGDLLVGMDGDFNCARWRGGPALLNQRVCKISVDSDLYDPRLLDALLPVYLAAINAETSSVTVKHLSSRTIEDIWLPLPPRHEQSRLAAHLEEVLSDLDQAVRDLLAAKEKVDLYWQSLLNAAMLGTLKSEQPASPRFLSPASHLPHGWAWVSLEQCCSVVSGYAFSSQSFTIEGTPVVKIANVGHGHYADDVPEDHLEHGFVASHAGFLVEPDDVLIALTRPITNNTLKSCRYPVGRPRALLNQRVALLRSLDPALASFLFYVTRSNYFRDCVARAATQTLQPNVSPVALRQFLIPLPPIPVATAIADYLAHLFAGVVQLGSEIQHLLVMAAAQRQNILRAAFSGQLVPQDPNDEPASVLLERIRAQRSATGDKPATRRPRKAKIAA